jgi:hypothetical protein
LLSLIVAGGASCGKGPMIISIGVGQGRALAHHSAKPLRQACNHGHEMIG